MRHPPRSRPLLIALAIALVLALGAPPAAAGSRSVADPRGDAARPRGDLRLLVLRYPQGGPGAGPDVRITLRTQAPFNVKTSKPWTQVPASKTQINIFLDTKGSAAPEFVVVVIPTPGGATSLVIRLSDQVQRCSPFVTQPDLSRIRVRFESTCIGAPRSFRAYARYWLDIGGNGTLDSRDRVPNGGYTPKVNRG